MATKVSLVRCNNYQADNVFKAVDKSIELIGGIDSIIKPNSRVLVKPNLLLDSRPEECITTHPRVVEAVIEILKRRGAKIMLGDSPSVFGEKRYFEKVYEATGMREVCQRQKVELVYFDKAVVKNGFPLTEWVDKCDYIINIPKFKTHGTTILTASIKNLFGLVTGFHKARIHKEKLRPQDFSKSLVDIFELARPVLNIVDAVVGLQGDGPGSAGVKADVGLIVSGQDAVSVDSVLATIMGLFPSDIPTTKEAASRRLGEARLENIEVLGEKLGEYVKEDFKLPTICFYHRLPPLFLDLAKRLIQFKMTVSPLLCQSCRKCIEICPKQAIDLRQDNAFIDSSECILCACCQEICPHKAINVRKSLILRLIGM